MTPRTGQLQQSRAGASPAPTIHERMVSFARTCDRRRIVGATLAVALKRLAVALKGCAVALTGCAVALEGCGRLGVLISTLFALILISLAFPPALVHAASNGRIFGQLLDGTHNNAPLVGQSVTLQMAQGNNAHDLASVKTDTHGSFAFNNLDTDKTINYAVYTRYQGAQYSSDLIDLSTKSLQQADLTVYEATTSTASIAIVQATALLHKPDAQGGVLSVSEILFFKNVGTYTYVGSLDASKGKPDALLFALPPNARNVSLSKGFDGYQVIQVDRGFATNAALPPGTSQFIFSFELPYTASNYNFSYDVVYPTVQFSLLVPPDVNVTSSALTSGGLITADQHPYRLYQARDLLAGTKIQAQLQGLPAVQSTATPVSNIWLIVVLLLMLAVLAVTWFLYRFTRRPSCGGPAINRGPPSVSGDKSRPTVGVRFIGYPTAGGAPIYRGVRGAERIDPARTDVAPEGVAGSRTGNKVMQRQQQALLQELLDLDKAYEAGKLKKAAYHEQRAKTKARLRALMNEEEARSLSAGATKKTARGGRGKS